MLEIERIMLRMFEKNPKVTCQEYAKAIEQYILKKIPKEKEVNQSCLYLLRQIKKGLLLDERS